VKRINYIVFFIFVLAEAFSQSTNVSPINQTRILAIREAKFTLDYSDVEGSPYYTKNFIKGVAYLKDGNWASIPLRYDLFRDEIEFLKENKIYWLKKSDILYVRYGSDMLILTHAVSDSSQLGYFFLKSTGNYKLLYKKKVEYYPEVPPKGYTETVPAKFKAESDINYIQFEGKPAIRIESKKDLSLFFSNNQLALDFIKIEKIRSTKSEDLEKLVTFLNSK
jgi:hypothetical protein